MNAVATPFSITFWGVRGSVPTPGLSFARYGGNTTCVELRCRDRLFVLDAGTGIKPLGDRLSAEHPDGGLVADLFLSHVHLDHIHGLPFFKPLYQGTNRFRIWSGHLGADRSIRGALDQFMQSPILPMPIDAFLGLEAFHDFEAGEQLSPFAGVTLKTHRLNHPDGATGYRFESGGKSVCFITDFEHDDGPHDDALIAFLRHADCAMLDSTYDEAEYAQYKGWGHATWQKCVEICQKAGVGLTLLSHHAPEHDDTFMDGLSARLGAMMTPGGPRASFSREGMTIRV